MAWQVNLSFADVSFFFFLSLFVSWQVNLWKAFAPFEVNLWLTLLIALIGTVILLWLYEGAKNDQFSEGNWGRRRRNVSRVGVVFDYWGRGREGGEGEGQCVCCL